MTARTWLATLVIALGCAWSAAPCAAGDEEAPKAKEGGDKQEPKKDADPIAEAGRRMVAMVKGMVDFVGDTRLTEASIQNLIKHGPSFHAVVEGEEDDEFDKLLEETYRKKGVYDFSLVLGVKELQTWARGRGVDAASWMRSMMRAQGLLMREQLQENYKQAKKQVAEQLAELEKSRKQLGEEIYQASRKALETSLKMAEQMAKAAAGIPAPTEAETKLLAKHGAKLRSAVEGDDGDGDGEDEDGGMDDDGGR